MPLNIIKASERIKSKPKINILLLGASGSGKTTQARTLDPQKTLFIDLEGGTLAIQDWPGDILDARKEAARLGCHPWEMCQAIACIIGGADPLATMKGDPYGSEAHAAYASKVCDPALLAKYDTLFIDSITVASRWCFAWASNHPEAFNREGKPDIRGAYGLLGRELIKFVTHLQHCDKSCIFACILEQTTNKLEQVIFEPQIMGSMTGRELPGIIDQVVTLATFPDPTAGQYRAFITQFINPYGFPAKDRSGCLALMERPNLAMLMEKIRAGKRLDVEMVTEIPSPKIEVEQTTEQKN